jgi:hypothetical protein
MAVELSAQRRKVNAQVYETLHRGLLALCRSLAAAADGEGRTFYESLESLAQPWMSVQVLEQADRQIRFVLLSLCRRVERRLNGRGWASRLRRWARAAVMPLAALAMLLVLGRAAEPAWFTLFGWLDDCWHMIWSAAHRYWGDAPRWVAVGFIVDLIAVYLVSYIPRADSSG